MAAEAPKADAPPNDELDFQFVMSKAPPAVQNTFVAAFKETPIKVNKEVVVTGNKQTQTDFIARELKFAANSATFGELEENLYKAIKNLESTEVFKSVEAKIAAGDDPRDIKIHVDVEEKTRTKFHVGASTDFSKGITTSTSMAIRNVFGRAEQLQGSVSLGPERYNFRGDFIKPRIGGSRWNLGVGAFREDDNFTAFSSYTLIGRGIDVRVFDTQKRHTFGVLQTWRDLVPTGRVIVSKQPGADGETVEVANTLEPSASIVKAASPSLKSSLYHEYVRDRRDNPTAPHRGTYFKLRTELAGLGGDVRFAKSDAFWKTYLPLGKWLTIGMSARVGVAQPWSAVFPSLQAAKGWNEDVPIPDRLFMGGPTSLRGFATHSVGPSSEGDALGGNLAAQTGLSLAYQFPPRFRILHDIGLRLQTYVDSGNTVSLADGKPVASKVRELMDESRASAGAGVMLPIPQLGGRLEINYNWPLYARPGDSIQRFQVGLGFEF